MATKKKPVSKSVNQSAVFQQIAADYGLTDALLNLDKTDPKKGFTLKEAFDQIRKEKITDPRRAAEILAKTNWFKTNGPEVTKRLVAEKQGLGAFKQELAAKKSELAKSLSDVGIALSDKDLAKLARDSYVYGLNNAQVLDHLGKTAFTLTGGGATENTLTDLDTLAYQNGVDIAPADRLAWGRDIALGKKSVNDYEQVLRDQASIKYGVFADQIKAGQNLSDLVKPYKAIAADLLEVPESEIDWNDPLFKDGKAFQTVDSTGKMTVKPAWQFRKEVMQDSRWQYTDNAKQTGAQFATNVLKRFGMVS